MVNCLVVGMLRGYLKLVGIIKEGNKHEHFILLLSLAKGICVITHS